MNILETKNIDDLHADPKNPRRLSKHDGQSLSESISAFGDLAPVVFNVRTQQLVGGHQRVEIFKRFQVERHVTITERFEQPDEVGTVALGFIIIGTKRFAYREVDWPESKQKAANIAANRIQGEFDQDLLAQVNYEISQLENGDELLRQTGQHVDEINNSMRLIGVLNDEPQDKQKVSNNIEFKVTEDQREIINEAINNVKSLNGLHAKDEASTNGMALHILCVGYLESLHKNEAPIA